ncbi:hypothetical protein DFQ29_001249 [Apophysomyces sp. BC1021]|nr:hypothetical protein DFQ29_001249 [Apophysomyces sp. BC1021]
MPRLICWIANLELYDPDIQYKPGKDNNVLDILSRRDGPECTTNEESLEPDYLYAVCLAHESDWPKFYVQPEEEWPVDLKPKLESQKHNFMVQNGVVFRKIQQGDTVYNIQYALFAKRADLVAKFH